MDQSSGGAAAQRAARTTAAGESILTKGERTAQRILDVAEQLFAEKGFEGTTLREIAAQVGIREPGLYNHFASKDVLYRSVLERGLQPLADAIDELLERDASPRELEELPANLTDLLALQPNIVALMHRNLLSSAQTPGRELMDDWLERLFLKGAALFEQVGSGGADQQEPSRSGVAAPTSRSGRSGCSPCSTSRRATSSPSASTPGSPVTTSSAKRIWLGRSVW